MSLTVGQQLEQADLAISRANPTTRYYVVWNAVTNKFDVVANSDGFTATNGKVLLNGVLSPITSPSVGGGSVTQASPTTQADEIAANDVEIAEVKSAISNDIDAAFLAVFEEAGSSYV